MQDPFSSLAGPDVRDVLGLRHYQPSQTKTVMLPRTEHEWHAAFSEFDLHSLNVTGSWVSVTLWQEGEFAARIGIGIVEPPSTMPEAIEAQFMAISGPLDGLERLPSGDFDMLASLGKTDGYVVAARGQVLTSVRTAPGVSARQIAQRSMNLVFAER